MELMETAIYVAILRTYIYFEETGRTNSFERFPFLKTLTERLTEETLRVWEEHEEIRENHYWELLQSIGNGEDVEPVVHTALDICLAVTWVPEFAVYLNYYTGNTATIQLAFELEGKFCPTYEEIVNGLRKLQKICRIDWKKVPLAYAAVEADHQLLAYLFAKGGTGGKILQFSVFGNGEWYLCEEPLHSMFVHQKLANECVEWLSSRKSQAVLQIAGSGGRRFLSKHVAGLLGKNLFLLSAEKCRDFFTDAAGEQQGELIRELFWHSGMLCLYGLQAEMFTAWQVSEEDFWKCVVSPLLEVDIPVLLCTEERLVFHDSCMIGKRVELQPLTREERQQVFNGFSLLYGLDIDCSRFSIRYRLSASEIGRAVELWKQEDPATEQSFTRISVQLLNGRSEKTLGSISYPTVKFADLKIQDEVRGALEQICCSAMYGYRIFEEWGLGPQYPYGRAVTVMLSGPPGTGKTMTVHAIACELGMPLYQVDLSAVMDKYIGETEKHLEQIFSFAEKTNVVLFFDEADALFGRRGEVTEGRDRYANMEVAFILQRIEQFDGIVILSTNFYNNIDKAFLRRMRYVLKYQMPDEAIRRSIWESCLPTEQFREEVDVSYLAEQFEFTGGMIKNVAMGACVAAVNRGEPLSMKHLLQAIRAEYEKMEWPVAAGMWGEYGYLMM